MATFVVTNSGAPGGSGLTFEEAVQQSIASAGPDTIRFAQDVTEVELDDAVTISGELIINGDFNGDGISDVVFDAVGDHRHLNIDATAEVTIFNVDFVGGFDRPKADDGTYLDSIRLPAAAGTAGSAGELTDPTYVFDGADAGGFGHLRQAVDRFGVVGIAAALLVQHAGNALSPPIVQDLFHISRAGLVAFNEVRFIANRTLLLEDRIDLFVHHLRTDLHIADRVIAVGLRVAFPDIDGMRHQRAHRPAGRPGAHRASGGNFPRGCRRGWRVKAASR